MSPRTEKQFEEIRTGKAELIMSTALKLFAELGYETTAISKIAKEAGISKGLMYNYFRSKEELLNAIILDGLKDSLGALNIANQESVKKEELVSFINTNLNLLKENPSYYKLYFSLIFQPKVLLKIENELMHIFGHVINSFINYYQQKGDEKPYVKARYILAVFDGVGMHYLSDINSFPIDDIKDMMIDLL